MFDTILNPSSGVPRQRWTTKAMSAVAHVAVIGVAALSALYATEVLPEPRESMAVFFAAPVPPPPPPVPAIEEPEPKRAQPVVTRRSTPRTSPVIAKAPIAAPIEAPSAITPETGLEGGEFSRAAIEPGFENGRPGGVIGGIVGGVGIALPPPPPPPAPAAPVRVGGEISAPRLVHRVDPEYPLFAQSAQIQGIVILEATVDRSGAVIDTKVVRSHSVLDEAAVDAVRQWRYEPLRLNGQATPFVLTVTVSFSLAGR
jgi:protein TonB